MQVINDETVELNRQAQILFIPYQLLRLSEIQNRLRNIKIAIVDQVFLLKEETLIDFLMPLKRLIILSGSCSLLSSPINIWPIMRLVRPDYIPADRLKFFERYADPAYKS